MRWSALLSTVALAVLAAADGTSNVISLTSGDFDQSVQAESLMLVEFFAPW
jgi:protein disulfide-isomerase A1